ncbi:MAG: chemotaxis-specific protein-glutamate methyltransferase CheB [Ghiorsea sp.]
MKVLIIDDSIVFRTFMRGCLRDLAEAEVVGTASNGREALEKMESLKPDLITLDMEMPYLSGIEVMKRMKVEHPGIKVIVVSCQTETDATRTIDALEAGAYDFILKPVAGDENPKKTLQDLLFPQIKSARSLSTVLGLSPAATRKPLNAQAGVGKVDKGAKVNAKQRQVKACRPDVVAIGSSTGGPAALHTLLKDLPADFPVPITITQHMPKMFLESLAQRINNDSHLSCAIAKDGEQLKPGHIYLAPGDVHMKIERKGLYLSVKLEKGERVHHCIPAVDVTYNSLVELAPRVKTLAVVLTGMGSDGALGAKALFDKKSAVIAQDEASSTVWGMPGETVRLGATQEVLPLNEIADALLTHAGCAV